MFEPEGGREDDDPVCDQCHEVADVLLIHHRMHHEDEQCKEDVVDELKSEEDPQVQPDLEIEITHPHLTEHSSRRHEGHQRDKRETQSQELAQEERPIPVPASRRQSRSARRLVPARPTHLRRTR